MTPTPPDEFDLELRLTPEWLRRELSRAGCLLALDRLLYQRTAVEVPQFFSDDAPSPLDEPASPLPGSDDPALVDALSFLAKDEILTPDDIELVWAIRRRSTEVMQRLPAMLLEGKSVGTEMFDPAYQLARKLGLFWA